MKSWKQWVREYFHFTRTERIAVLVLFAGILILKMLPYYWKVGTPPEVGIPDSLLSKLISLDRIDSSLGHPVQWNNQPAIQKNKELYRKRTKEPELFFFNPNLATEEELERLGLPPNTIRTLVRFRNSGGRFRTGKDLNRIFGMPGDMAARLEPFVRMKDAPGPRVPVAKPWLNPSPKRLIDINTADSLTWIGLPGIGPRLSGRILQYREKLGGFYHISQLAEVYGLQDSVYRQLSQYLQVTSPVLNLLDINEAGFEELARHPYIRWKLARAIIRYRVNHGRFQDIKELGKLHLVNQELLSKLSPYCKIE